MELRRNMSPCGWSSVGREPGGKVVVILGPTSSGKSDIAIKLAKKFGGEIISADSRQIYRGMDIGTGKIRGTWNMKHKTFVSENVPHYMIDIASPRNNYNVAKFKKDAEKIIDDILKRKKLPIIRGGTGFWIKAIVDNVNFPKVKPDQKLRKRLEMESTSKLFSKLKKLDPERAKNIDRNNKVRLIRAIEIASKLGKVPSAECRVLRYDFMQIGINVSKRKLHQNIEKRLKKRFRQGMIAEVQKLHRNGLSWKKIQSFGLGYYWIPLYLQGKLDEKELFEKVYQAEKDCAKRQMTWFKKDERIEWLNGYKNIEQSVKSFLKKSRPEMV